MLAFVARQFVSKHEGLAIRTQRSLTGPLSVQNWKTQRLTPVPKVLCFHAICTMADEHQSSVEQKAEMLSRCLSEQEQ